MQINNSMRGIQYDLFEWRMSAKEISSIFHVFVMKKFSPWKERINKQLIRIIEGDLLKIANPVNALLENKNPHR